MQFTISAVIEYGLRFYFTDNKTEFLLKNLFNLILMTEWGGISELNVTH